MNLRNPRLALALALPALLAACAVAHKPATDPNVLALYDGRPLAAWHVTVADFESQAPLTGAAVTVPKPAGPRVPESQVEAHVSDKAGRGDALTLYFTSAWYATLRLEGGTPLDLRPFVADGTLEFDLDVVDMAHGGVGFKIACGDGCERKLPYLRAARALQGKGWQHLAFPMRCFARDGDNFGAVAQPFALEGSGTGEVAVANVRFVRGGQPNASCPDYRTESVTPSTLDHSWSIDWWVPRHEQKLAQIRELAAAGKRSDVVFIGDSITEGWEKSGKPVWDRHYAKYNALDLGFGGDHTENVLWRLQHGELDGIRPKVVVMMIGTNNTGDRQEDPRTTAAGVRRLVDEVRQRLPATRILLLAVFPREEKPDGPLRQINNRVNAIISGYADGQKVFFLDINAFLLNTDGTLSRDVMPDLLHPNEKGYEIWAARMAPTLLKLLAQP
ncbi:MAG: GDSL-type esterase/lipase family protein [Betaproteobacteria bacterium]